MFSLLLYIALGCLVAGLLIRLRIMIRKRRFFEPDSDTFASQVFRVKPMAAVFNTLFQVRLARVYPVRWCFHFLVFTGFLYLLAVHALDDVTYVWFTDYQPTIHPFRFLRNLAGSLVLAGSMGFLARRFFIRRSERRAALRGLYSVCLVLGLILTGFLTEGLQIISQAKFDEMVEEWSDLDEETGLADLKAYWAAEYHVVFDRGQSFPDADLAAGETYNEDYCLACHVKPATAFVSKEVAIGLRGIGPWLNQFRADLVLYWLHYGIALLLLGSLPFSRMLHVLMIPLSSVRKRVGPDRPHKDMGAWDVLNIHACTDCGICSRVCSVVPCFRITGNPLVLPHGKIHTIKRMTRKGVWDADTVMQLRRGNDDCTGCGRCADVCPSGIDLVRLWQATDQLLTRLGCPANSVRSAETDLRAWMTATEGDAGMTTCLADQVDAFENCVQCTICTNACPVVAHDLTGNDMGPHQVMNLLRLGHKQMASGSRMVWHCLTCYMCQELCPKGIRVADILLELRHGGHGTAAVLTRSKLKEGDV